MPLPLIPVLIGGAALLTGGYGVKKGLDAKENFNKAERITDQAKDIYETAQKELETVRQETQQSLESLGEIKFKSYNEFLEPFVEAAQKIKHIEQSDNLAFDTNISIAAELAEIREIRLQISEVLTGGATALAGGALAGFGAFGAAGALATASTGTAISALSGVAATNATLAWFGGGSLAAGGLGMAGGAAILGGVVAGPVLAVGGLVLASKAESAVNDAYSNLEKAKGAAESMKAACTGARAIRDSADELNGILQKLMPYCLDINASLQKLVERETDYRIIKQHEEDRFIVTTSFALARTVANILKTPLFDDEGSVTQELLALVQESRDFLNQLADM